MIMPNVKMSAALAAEAGADWFLRLPPPTPTAIVILINAGMKENVSKKCRILKPPKETSRERSESTTIPTVGVTEPEEMAERHWPPITQIMVEKPVKVARFRMTGMDTT